MLRNVLRCVLCAAITIAALSSAVLAQDKDKDSEDYRRFFRKPETVLEHWNAIQFELDVGRADLAAKHLHGLTEKKPTDTDILKIIDKDGLGAILRLRNVPVWSRQPKVQAQAVKEVEALVAAATAAQKKRLGDPARIRALITQLQASPEEQAYALRELYKSGANAVPIMVDSLIKATDAPERLALLRALSRMGSAGTAPLLAALDCDSPRAKLDILEILRTKHVSQSKQIVPFLWYLSAAKTELPEVRKKATAILSEFLDVPASRLVPVKVALTREAERYYRHEVTFGDPRAVTIWRWDDAAKSLVSGWPGAPTVTATQAEEYYGLRFAREALALDPEYRPAQVVLLSLAIEKAVDRGGLGTPLSRSAPTVAELLAKSSSELLIELLDQAMREGRTGVVLETVRVLGSRAERTAKRPTSRGESPLVRALYYPDARVQLAAVESLLRIPGPPAPRTSARIIEILSRVLTPMASLESGRKVLVAVSDLDWRRNTAAAVITAGYEPLTAENGREAMRILRANGDIQAVLLDSSLPLPGLDFFLGELRADVDCQRMPVLLAAVPETRLSRDAAARYRFLEARKDVLLASTARYRNIRDASAAEEARELTDIQASYDNKTISGEVRDRLLTDIRKRYTESRRDLQRTEIESVTLLKEIPQMESEMADLAVRYDLESRIRENSLSRFTNRYANVRVVHATFLTDAKALKSTLARETRAAGTALSSAERKQAAETAIRILASLSVGRPEGYDVRPATASILNALRAGGLSPEGQIAAITACGRLRGAAVQSALASTILDGARPIPVRIAATTALVDNFQRFSILLTEEEFAPLRALSRQPGLDTKLKEQLDVLLGSIRPGDRATGIQLREYKPAPAAVIPPPAPPK